MGQSDNQSSPYSSNAGGWGTPTSNNASRTQQPQSQQSGAQQNNSSTGWGTPSSAWGSPAPASSPAQGTENTSSASSGWGTSNPANASSPSGGAPASASAWGTPVPDSGSSYSNGAAAGAASTSGNVAGGTATQSATGNATSAAATAVRPLPVAPITFLSLGVGLICSLLVWPFAGIVQGQVAARLVGYVVPEYAMTANRGMMFSSVVFCAFIVLYLSAKYIRVFTSGDLLRRAVCYVVMAIVASFLLSRIAKMGYSIGGSADLAEGVLPWNAMLSALVPSAFLFVGAMLLSRADNVPKENKTGRIGLYAIGIIVMVVSSVVIALSVGA